jgi:hypothetical protein
MAVCRACRARRVVLWVAMVGGLAIASRPTAGDSPNAKDWPQYNPDNRGWRFNSGETAISPATVGGLVEK